ncbi:MAG TPA: translation initiation factor IF-3 [Polyangiaceae bacterium]|nr:translation initiation factor IF-3 [Polyangiaceae bacterium]
MGRRFSREPRGPQIRINHRIRVPEVRVVDDDGSNLGVIPTDEALRRAQSKGLDLVEVNPKAAPPVCKILDFGKYKYEEKKRQREAKKRQTVVEVKEIKLRPKTDDHDLNVKVRAARKFLEAGNKVKVICRFRGREITHPQIAAQQLEFIVSHCEELANVEQRPTMEGRAMTIIISPKPQVLHRLAQERSRQTEEKLKAEKAGLDPTGTVNGDLDEDLDDEDEEEDDDDDDEAGGEDDEA